MEQRVGARGRTVLLITSRTSRARPSSTAYAVCANDFAGVSTPLRWGGTRRGRPAPRGVHADDGRRAVRRGGGFVGADVAGAATGFAGGAGAERGGWWGEGGSRRDRQPSRGRAVPTRPGAVGVGEERRLSSRSAGRLVGAMVTPGRIEREATRRHDLSNVMKRLVSASSRPQHADAADLPQRGTASAHRCWERAGGDRRVGVFPFQASASRRRNGADGTAVILEDQYHETKRFLGVADRRGVCGAIARQHG